MNTLKADVQESSTQFELTKDVLLRLNEFELTPTGKLVLVYLTSCYNRKNSNVVFPKVETIANVLGLGLTATKQAIKDLITSGCILKSKQKRSGNFNKYALTQKVVKQPIKRLENGLLNSRKPTVSCSMNKKNEQKTTTTVVAFSKNQLECEIPHCLQLKAQKGEIKNLQGYWKSLDDVAKQNYINLDVEIAKKQKRSEERKRLLELEKQRIEEEKRKHIEECNKPLNEQYTYEQACTFIKKMGKLKKSFAYGGLCKSLSDIYNINVDELLNDV